MRVIEAEAGLRGLAPGDLDALHALDALCFAPPFRFTRSAMRRFATAANALVVLAEQKAELAGFCIAHVETQQRATVAYVVTLDVAPAQRRRGLAARLMAELERHAAAQACTAMTLHVWVENTSAIAFYERWGYVRSHVERGFYGPGVDAWLYSKALPSLQSGGRTLQQVP